jgi:hypothetical protein
MSGLRVSAGIVTVGLSLVLLGWLDPIGEVRLVAGAFGAATALDVIAGSGPV